MRTVYFCYNCGSSVQKQQLAYECPECQETEFFSSAHMTFFHYEMSEFLHPVFEEEQNFWWEESTVYEHGTAIYVVRIPSNFGIIPRDKIGIVNGIYTASHVTIEEMN